MFKNGGYSLSDIAAVTGNNNNDGMFGNNGAWWIIILLLCGWGNGGWGNGNGGSTVREEVAYGFDMNGLENNVRGVQQGLCDGFYAMNNSLLTGFGSLQNNMNQGFSGLNMSAMQNTNALMAQLNNMAANNASCCCETQRQIERGFCELNYNLANQSCDTRRAIYDSTRDIIDSNNAGVRSILDFLTQDKIAALQAENQTLKFAASQQAQNNYLISQLRDPCPVPAYPVPNPNCCNNEFSNMFYNYLTHNRCNNDCCCR